jgi:hypothetical protein
MSFWQELQTNAHENGQNIALTEDQKELLRRATEADHLFYATIRPNLDRNLEDRLSKVGFTMIMFHEVLIKLGIFRHTNSQNSDQLTPITKEQRIRSKSLYFELAKSFHPDRCLDSKSSDLFKHIVSAYEIGSVEVLEQIKIHGLEYLDETTKTNGDSTTLDTGTKCQFINDLVYLASHPRYNSSIIRYCQQTPIHGIGHIWHEIGSNPNGVKIYLTKVMFSQQQIFGYNRNFRLICNRFVTI